MLYPRNTSKTERNQIGHANENNVQIKIGFNFCW